MKIEAGKYYRTRDGRKDGPMTYDDNTVSKYVWDGDVVSYTVDGFRFDETIPDSGDLIAEWTNKPETHPETGTPKLWRDMTPEEKGALLLAHHDGKVIEQFGLGHWGVSAPVEWLSYEAYRICPDPVRETVKVIIWHDDGDTELGSGTIDLIDGEPDPASVKMDRVKWQI